MPQSAISAALHAAATANLILPIVKAAGALVFAGLSFGSARSALAAHRALHIALVRRGDDTRQRRKAAQGGVKYRHDSGVHVSRISQSGHRGKRKALSPVAS
jgi:hypothetical protein